MKVGIDIVSISRFEKLVKNSAFLEKIFTKSEIDYAKTRKNFAETLAGLFAAKEAFLKAKEVGVLNGIKLTEIEITHNKNGAPELVLGEKLKKIFNIKNVAVSISHDAHADAATAICIGE